MLHIQQVRAFKDEMQKIGAIDPMHLAGMVAGGKIMATNALARFGHKLPPVRWLGKEIAGIGMRTGMQGKPMLSSPLRHAMAIGVDPKMTGLYEHAHAAGSLVKDPAQLQSAINAFKSMPEARAIPSVAHAADFASQIPLESKGIRKGVDYLFTDARQVGRDIKSGVGNLVNKFRGSPAAAPTLPSASAYPGMNLAPQSATM